MSYESKEIICLGRPFHPGTLYDCRKDELLPALTLWNLDKLKNGINSHPKKFTKFEQITEDTLSEKSSKLGVDASLKLSFLSGMINVEGSAHYLNDRKKSSKQERHTLIYSTLSRFDTLSMNLLGNGEIQHSQIFETTDATHVVTAVEYGADAIFIFDRDVGSSEDQHEVSGSLKVAMNLFIGGIEGKVTSGEGERISYEKIRCTFYGDVTLDSSPSNLIDATQVYQELSKIIKNCAPVPKKAWLYPLAKLDSKAAKLVREISSGYANQTEMILEKLHEAGIKAKDILQLCQPIFENQKIHIERFRHSLDEFKISFQNKLLPILRQIRGGEMEEEKLADLLKEMLNSPFNPGQLQLWLEGKEDEIELLNDYFNQLREGLKKYDVPIKITRTEAKLLLNDIKCGAVVGFAFNNAKQSDLFLNHMINYLQNNLINVEENVKPQFSHQDASVIKKIREIMPAFINWIDINCNSKNANANVEEDIKKTKYMVYAEEDMDKHYACIMLHNLVDGTKTEFMPPSVPKILAIEILDHPFFGGECKNDTNILFKWGVSKEGFKHVNSYIVQYMDTEKKEWNKSERREVNNNKESDSNYIADIISGLKLKKTYIFRICSVSLGGTSEFSETKSIKLTSVPKRIRTTSKCQDLDVIKWWVEDGKANVEAINKYGQTVLHWAVLGGNLNDVKWLVEHGKAKVEAKNKYNMTVLIWAAKNHGTDVNAKNKKNKWEIVKWLVEYGKANVKATDNDGQTVLHWAVLGGNLNEVKWLVEHGKAQVEAKNKYNMTVLIWAAKKNKWKIVKWLIEHGKANVKATDNDDQTVLHWAVLGGNLNDVKWLVEHGADVNAKNKYAKTPLNLAKHKKITEYLKTC